MANEADLRFTKRIITITATGASTSKNISLGTAQFAKVVGFRAKAGSDTTTTIGLADARGRTFYLDAATKDYATAAVNRVWSIDNTTTGMGFTAVDSTGAAAGTGEAFGNSPIVEGPLTVTWGSATAGDTLRLELMLDVGSMPSGFRQRAKTLTVPAGATSVSAAFGFGGVKYGRVNNLRASITSGTDTSTIIGLADAKNRVFYLDAAGADYTTAKNYVIGLDDTQTGLNFSGTDSTGAAAAAAEILPLPVVEFPVTATWSSATAGESLRLELTVEV